MDKKQQQPSKQNPTQKQAPQKSNPASKNTKKDQF